MPTCKTCSLTYPQSSVYCPNCGTNNVPPPVPPKASAQVAYQPRHQTIVQPQRMPAQQPQVVYVNQKGSSGFNVLMWLIVFIILGGIGLVCFLPGLLYVLASSAAGSQGIWVYGFPKTTSFTRAPLVVLYDIEGTVVYAYTYKGNRCIQMFQVLKISEVVW